MGTRSRIFMENTDGTFTGIYCHWDGYPDHNGKILVNHYRDEGKIVELMKLGDLSSLGNEIGEKHDFNTSDTKWCKAYGRDRGESDTKAAHCATLNDVFALAEEYTYIWCRNASGIRGGRWTCYNSSNRPISLDEFEE